MGNEFESWKEASGDQGKGLQQAFSVTGMEKKKFHKFEFIHDSSFMRWCLVQQRARSPGLADLLIPIFLFSSWLINLEK